MTFEMRNQSSNQYRRGSALVFALIAVSALALMGGAAWTLAASTSRTVNHSREDLRSFYLAEAGISEGLAAVAKAVADETTPAASIGSEDSPCTLNNGSYWVSIVEDAANQAYRITATAKANGAEHALEAVVKEIGETVYAHALFAGNSSGDPNYTLRLSGDGAQADQVEGDVYSGGDLMLDGTSGVDGILRATGAISGGSGESGITQPIPDLASMDYSVNNDVDVKAAFDAGAVYNGNAELGGSAWELPEEHPAHILRKDPSDRASDTSVTEKDDYFLEDPYELMRRDEDMDGSDACEITLSGTEGEPGVSGSGKVYYIDGNLWLHNRKTYSFKMTHGADEATVVTFVVKGNVYFSDNLFYQDDATDAIAFIALKDPAVADSGNIYFGDPLFGTLEQMHAFMYAENDFHDVNLNAAGSANVHVYGNMTAGNHVDIDRDFDTGSGIVHSQLIVDFDARIVNKEVEPPGLPLTPGGAIGVALVSWREVSAR